MPFLSHPFSLLLTLLLSSQLFSPSQTQIHTLVGLRRLLDLPSPLSALLNSSSNPCSIPPSPSFSCSNGSQITYLSISGGDRLRRPLSAASTDALFTTLSQLPHLTSLSLVSLGLHGPLPPQIHRLSSLQLLNLSSNSFSGPIPPQVSAMRSLQNLILAGNSFDGTVPDFESLTAITELDLRGNRLVGEIPPPLFSLPSLEYLDLSGNKLSGRIPTNLSCSGRLRFINISDNLLIGALPSCFRTNSPNRVVDASANCLDDSKNQKPVSYCNQRASTANLPTHKVKSGSQRNLGLIFGIVGGIVGGVALLVLLVVMVLRKMRDDHPERKTLQISDSQKSSIIQVTPRNPPDTTRHASQAVMNESLGLIPYRVFTMKELATATNNFDISNLTRDGPHKEYYKGLLQDDSMIMIRCFNLKQKYSPQILVHCMDIISKLRHQHLVSIIGHCIDDGRDNANTTVFLVFEYISNGTLRSHLTEWRKRAMMKWPQRVAALIGIARGIKFLHSVTDPGIVGNDLTTEDVLLDKTLTAKIANYNLPALPSNKTTKGGPKSPIAAMEDDGLGSSYVGRGERKDIYQLGLILLETITGKSLESQEELDVLILQLQRSLNDGPEKLKEMTDPTIHGTFACDSLKTAVEITLNCLSKDSKERPSIDDVIWNLQYSVQVQDGWATGENVSIKL